MPDISMCSASDCILSRTCYRHEDSGTKPCEYRQSYFMRTDLNTNNKDGTVSCDYYWTRGVDFQKEYRANADE